MNGELVPFLHSTTMKGEAAMDSSMLKKPDSVDYVVAHPLCLPLWAAVFGWMVQTFGIGFYWLIPLFFFAFWFYSYLKSAPRLFASYGRQESITSIQKPEVAGVATGRTVL